MVQDCFHQPLGHLFTYEHLARAAHRVHAHEAWCARGHSLHLALQAFTVCVCVPRTPNFAARHVTDVFVEKKTTAEMTLAKKWFVEDGENPMEITRRLGRITCTLTGLLTRRMARKRHGAD